MKVKKSQSLGIGFLVLPADVDGHIKCHGSPRENGGSTWNMGAINVACGTEFVSYCGFLALLNVVSKPASSR